ncbi:hypothetical protein CYMTET_17240 [Cymbomonas tetramitiformis]|uniref:Uncharacterized protein n=1 Tax=Cymbomonas tetramitiformis TaxID=36881 RepID=A0AAE0GAI4_9CHLO|nr:hypothetical protein CYMTET_17240 [Cymbomonas tetramitiformis]
MSGGECLGLLAGTWTASAPRRMKRIWGSDEEAEELPTVIDATLGSKCHSDSDSDSERELFKIPGLPPGSVIRQEVPPKGSGQGVSAASTASCVMPQARASPMPQGSTWDMRGERRGGDSDGEVVVLEDDEAAGFEEFEDADSRSEGLPGHEEGSEDLSEFSDGFGILGRWGGEDDTRTEKAAEDSDAGMSDVDKEAEPWGQGGEIEEGDGHGLPAGEGGVRWERQAGEVAGATGRMM